MQLCVTAQGGVNAVRAAEGEMECSKDEQDLLICVVIRRLALDVGSCARGRNAKGRTIQTVYGGRAAAAPAAMTQDHSMFSRGIAAIAF